MQNLHIALITISRFAQLPLEIFFYLLRVYMLLLPQVWYFFYYDMFC